MFQEEAPADERRAQVAEASVAKGGWPSGFHPAPIIDV
jgi:hypothetical protein